MNSYIKTSFISLMVLSACHQRPIPSEQPTPSAQGQQEEAVNVTQDGPVLDVLPEDAQEVEPPPPLFRGTLPIPTPVIPDGLSSISAQECNSCHFDTHDTWSGSDHQRGWNSENHTLFTAEEPLEPFCTGCHLPIASQHTDTSEQDNGSPTGDIETWDPTLQQEGVTCATCHVRDGTVYGVHATDNSPHPVTPTPELQSSELCATCHQLSWPEADRPIYDTYGEWSRSWYAEAGITCQTCHMRPTAGVATAGELGYYADHSTSIDSSRAITLQVSLDSPIATRGQEFIGSLSITNTGSGHAFPTGSPFKAVVVSVTLLDADQESTADTFTGTIARVVQEEAPWNTISDNTLSPSESNDWNFNFVPNYRSTAGLATLKIDVAFRHANGDMDQPFTTQSIPVTLR